MNKPLTTLAIATALAFPAAAGATLPVPLRAATTSSQIRDIGYMHRMMHAQYMLDSQAGWVAPMPAPKKHR